MWAARKEEAGKCQMEGKRRLNTMLVCWEIEEKGQEENGVKSPLYFICNVSNSLATCTVVVHSYDPSTGPTVQESSAIIICMVPPG